MWWTVCKGIAKIYGILWIAAVGGIFGANWVGLAATFLTDDTDVIAIQAWSHAGWYVGTGLFLVGAASGKLKTINGSRLGWRPNKRREHSSSIAEGTDSQRLNETAGEPLRRRINTFKSGEQSGLLGCVLGGALVGGFCSFLFGASLVVFFFSLAYSPYAPKHITSSVHVERPQSHESAKRNSFRTDHPAAIYACLLPGVLGTVAGAMAGGAIWVLYRDKKTTDAGP